MSVQGRHDKSSNLAVICPFLLVCMYVPGTVQEVQALQKCGFLFVLALDEINDRDNEKVFKIFSRVEQKKIPK